MYELTIEHEFCAAHAIVMGGDREPLHGHNWHVTVCVGAASLDEDGLVCDFHAVEQALHTIVEPFHNRCMNDVSPFDRINPTAEHIAQFIGTELGMQIEPRVRVLWSRVTEAPGCAAVWRNV